jgi:quinol monooxygenase YgiN
VEVDPDNRDEAVAVVRDLVTRARDAPGGLDLAITADSDDPTRINNFERWESRAHCE